MSCTARLPIYGIFIAAFFAKDQGLMLLLIYVLGIVVALIVAAILKRTMFKGLSTPFVMELPTYKVPSVKGILLHTWEKVKGFLRKAGTIILVCSVVLWILQNIFPWGGTDPQMSLLGMIGTVIAPIFAPLGFGTWQAAVAIIAGLAAKEVVVATFGTLAGMEEDDEEGITALVHDTFTPLSAFHGIYLIIHPMFRSYWCNQTRNQQLQMGINYVCNHISYCIHRILLDLQCRYVSRIRIGE